MNTEERSNRLFGRYDALSIWAAVAGLRKEQFTTGEIVALSGVGGSVVSKELKRLAHVGLLQVLSRRGDYERRESNFWALAECLAEEWRGPDHSS